MNNAESKYYRTAVRMNQAFLELLGEKDYNYITVKEICERAEVNRTTFYLHYDGISDLLDETLKYASEKFHDSFRRMGDEIPDIFASTLTRDSIPSLEQLLLSYLEFVRSNRVAVLAAYNNPTFMKVDLWMGFLNRNVMDPILDRYQIPEEERIYWKNYYKQGTQAIVRTWVEHDCSTPVDEICRIILRCIRAQI